ncbi:unnamed protein product, partial [Mesorhabditis belari]|uniref:C-type lectin domain-containing protein n=1 Tax=Mesorhabditis belari TaxID=2138241 RepID=A0AAF3FQS3_9BILA
MRLSIFFAILRLLLTQDPQCPNHYQYPADLDICLNEWTAKTTWSYALSTCRDDGGEFISIHNAFENAVWANIQQRNRRFSL